MLVDFWEEDVVGCIKPATLGRPPVPAPDPFETAEED